MPQSPDCGGDDRTNRDGLLRSILCPRRFFTCCGSSQHHLQVAVARHVENRLLSITTCVIPFFALPSEVRKIVYTTNAVESLHMSLRKIIKTRGLRRDELRSFS